MGKVNYEALYNDVRGNLKAFIETHKNNPDMKQANRAMISVLEMLELFEAKARIEEGVAESDDLTTVLMREAKKSFLFSMVAEFSEKEWREFWEEAELDHEPAEIQERFKEARRNG